MMENVQLILFLLIFFVMALAMFFRKIPAIMALPIMAFLIPIAGGVSLDHTVQHVIGEGAVKLHNAYTVALFGSMLSVLLQKTGVAEGFIKKGAELAGDNPWIIGVIMLALISLLFTTMGGLGAIIMVATIVLPIMSSVGIGPMTVVGIFLIGLSMGGILNPGNWAVYVDVLGLTVEEIRPFALIMFSITFLMALVYITIQLFNDGHDLKLKRIFIRAVTVLVMLTVLF
ncbi:MAG: citrate transporter, partial [Caldithrix sp.]|nr:citrate transporter [Caldithrix sp.]